MTEDYGPFELTSYRIEVYDHPHIYSSITRADGTKQVTNCRHCTPYGVTRETTPLETSVTNLASRHITCNLYRRQIPPATLTL